MSGTVPTRRPLRRLLAVSVAVFCLAAGEAQSAQIACFAPADAKQARLREMQQEFTVAALSCESARAPTHTIADRYNAFIGKFAEVLRDNARLLTVHFSGHGGPSGFDAWMTKLANAASVRAATDPAYCQRSWGSLELALVVEPSAIADFALVNTEESELVPMCKERRVAKPAPAHKPSPVLGLSDAPRVVASE